MKAIPLIPAIQEVRVPLPRDGYAIEIGTGVLGRAGEFVGKCCRAAQAVVVSDSNVAEPYGLPVAESLQRQGMRVSALRVPAGENSKSADMLHELWNGLAAFGADRHTVVVAVGGGVVGDLAGFAAATFMRGLPLVQIPTTLLAQVDSSVGGKTGINLGGKNLVGAFWQPRGVLIDTDVLASLTLRQYVSGLAEVVKYGVIMDGPFFDYLEANAAALLNRQPDALRKAIARCCELKAQVVVEDERETTGRRAILNYGHTFGHAIEVVTGYGEYLHGEAVAMGMHCAALLAHRAGKCDAALIDRQRRLLAAFDLPTQLPALNCASLVAAMERDKKTVGGQLRFVLPDRIGNVTLVEGISSDDVVATLQAAMRD